MSNSLDESSVQVVQSLPRVLRDVEAVKQETILLREQMRIVKEDIKQVHTISTIIVHVVMHVVITALVLLVLIK